MKAIIAGETITGDKRIEFTRVEEGRFMMNLKHPDGSGDSREYSFVGQYKISKFQFRKGE